jgi:excisionase family DNA binding protein
VENNGTKVTFLTVADLAQMLSVPVRTIYEWNSVGSGPAYYRVGRYVRYRPSDVKAWLEEQKRNPDSDTESEKRERA